MRNLKKYIFISAVIAAVGVGLIVKSHRNMPTDLRDAVASGSGENMKSAELDASIPPIGDVKADMSIPSPEPSVTSESYAAVLNGTQTDPFMAEYNDIDSAAFEFFSTRIAGKKWLEAYNLPIVWEVLDMSPSGDLIRTRKDTHSIFPCEKNAEFYLEREGDKAFFKMKSYASGPYEISRNPSHPVQVKKMGYKQLDGGTYSFLFWIRMDSYVDPE